MVDEFRPVFGDRMGPCFASWPARPFEIRSKTMRVPCACEAIGANGNWPFGPTCSSLQARRNGITRVEVSEALQLGFEGRVVGFYREPGDAVGGCFRRRRG
jgi:hypothetical protein